MDPLVSEYEFLAVQMYDPKSSLRTSENEIKLMQD